MAYNRRFPRFHWLNLHFLLFQYSFVPELYHVCRVLFGLTSSPLTATLITHIKKYETENLEFVNELLESLHVDDLNAGKQTEDEAFEFYAKTKKLLSDGHFNLRKFKSNSVELENRVYEKYPEDKLFSEDCKVLGLSWDKHGDKIIFDFHEICAKFVTDPTKRSMLQSIASIYDPLSLSPITVKMKNLYQDVCTSGISWDEELTADFMLRWKNIFEQLGQIDQLVIPRRYCSLHGGAVIAEVQIHYLVMLRKKIFPQFIYGSNLPVEKLIAHL